MIKNFDEFILNEAADFNFWYPQFQGRLYSSRQHALDDIKHAVEFRNKQGSIFSVNHNADEVSALFSIEENPKLKKNAWYIKPLAGLKAARKPQKVYTYETSSELRRKQIRIWEEVHSTEFGRGFSAIQWLQTNDSRIYGTESVDPSNVLHIKRLLKEGEELPPLLLDYDFGILDGHHRYEAALALKIKQIPYVMYYKEDEDEDY